ncbi:MAG: alkaline phosphatase [Bacteroidales bacterium]
MNKRALLSLALGLGLVGPAISYAKSKEVKNVIVMIPDGTSTSVLSISRWYKQAPLAVDKYISGMVTTHCSDTPIGDSAPTGATYATGVLARTGNISIFPEATPNDLVKVDPSKTYQPAFTLLEAAKIKGKATGLVFTCQLPHATPADFASHGVSRRETDRLAKQMVYNGVDVVFGGGWQYLDPKVREDGENLYNVLQEKGIGVIKNKSQFEKIEKNTNRVWGLFAPDALPFEDEKIDTVPSIASMTAKAIDMLSKDKDGFFLMVEGSKVDWAAHANDTKGVITEYLAFDDAVKVAMDFAEKNGNTVVVVMPDHGNGGISLGNAKSSGSYSKTPHNTIFEPFKKIRVSQAMASVITEEMKYAEYVSLLQEEYGVTLRGDEGLYEPFLQVQKELALRKAADYSANMLKYEGLIGKAQGKVSSVLISVVNRDNYIGWTTSGHEGEDVFLATYSPVEPLRGIVKNSEVNHYIQRVSDIKGLEQKSDAYFARHDQLFKGYEMQIGGANEKYPELTVTNPKNGKVMKFEAFKDFYYLNGKRMPLQKKGDAATTIVGFTEAKNHKAFYLPTYLVDVIK